MAAGGSTNADKFRITRWLAFALVAVLLPLASPTNSAEAVAPGDATAIRQVIEQQIEAFGRDDGVVAFAYASPNIRALFGTSEVFMSMVRAGYQAVYRPRQLTFKEVLAQDGQVVQGLAVLGADGSQVLMLYFMERQPEGDWRIDGVQLLALPGQAT
ncbi:MAG: DUF4864 domain-containing protein [Alphaproteobacteria bacterium]